MVNIIIFTASIAISLISLKYFAIPYVWICLSWFASFLWFSTKASKTNLKFVLLYFSVFMLTFGVYEGYLAIRQKAERVRIVEVKKNNKLEKKYHWISHDILGYAPQKNSTIGYKVYDGNRVLKNITITIDEDGLRISPPYKEVNEGCILFFGGSYTFGDNVNDDETVPYRTGIISGGNYRIYNFGFSGYGPHQMLSALEHGLVDNIIHCKPRFVIYQAIWYHIRRSAGLVTWDRHGPKYRLDKNGMAVYDGHFDDGKFVLPKKLTRQFHKSLIFEKIWKKYFAIKTRPININDERLYFSIVVKARDFVETRYPGCQFHVIYWDYEKGEKYNRVIRGLRKKGIRVHLVSRINPNIFKDHDKYHLSFDTHPNSLAYDSIAKYIVKEIINGSSPDPV